MGINQSAKVTVNLQVPSENGKSNEVQMDYGTYVAPIAENDEVVIYSTKVKKHQAEQQDKKFGAYRVINTKLAQSDGRFIVRPKNSLNVGATLAVRPLKSQNKKIYYVINKGPNVEKWLRGECEDVPNKYDSAIRENSLDALYHKRSYQEDRKSEISNESLELSVERSLEPRSGRSALDDTTEADGIYTGKINNTDGLPLYTIEISPSVKTRKHSNIKSAKDSL